MKIQIACALLALAAVTAHAGDSRTEKVQRDTRAGAAGGAVVGAIAGGGTGVPGAAQAGAITGAVVGGVVVGTTSRVLHSGEARRVNKEYKRVIKKLRR